MIRHFSMLLVVFGLSACCSNVTTDPRSGGLAGGVCGTQTGAYQQRLDQRKARLTQLNQIGSSLSVRNQAASSQLVYLSERSKELGRRLGQRDKDLDRLDLLLNRALDAKAASERHLGDLRLQVASLRQRHKDLIAENVHHNKIIDALQAGIEERQDENTLDRLAIEKLEKQDAQIDAEVDDLEQAIIELLQ